jgi:hypothetical protein
MIGFMKPIEQVSDLGCGQGLEQSLKTLGVAFLDPMEFRLRQLIDGFPGGKGHAHGQSIRDESGGGDNYYEAEITVQV